MKRTFLKYTFACLLITFYSAISFAQAPVSITGTLKTNKVAPVKLFRVSEGSVYEMAVAIPGKDRKFGFLFFPPYEGFYVLGTGNVYSPNDNYKFYFKSGDKMSLEISDTSYTLTGANTRENLQLAQWHQLTNPLEQKAINFMGKNSIWVDFFPDLEEIAAKAKKFLNGKTTGNKKFDQQMKDNMDWDMAGYAINFLNTPRESHPKVEQYSKYYATLKATAFAAQTKGTYRQPWGKRILEMLVGLNMRQQNIQSANRMETLANTLKLVPNDTLKGDFVLQTGSRMKTITDYHAMLSEFGKYILTDSQQQRSKAIQAPIASLKAGEPGLNFSYPDKDGKMVSMQSLKGKVVLIDVWATWCGPCKAEIPHLKKLEEEMKGTDVQIVSISVDEEKDKEKWKEMIKKENLGGMQLFATGWSDITKYYKINGIPRFMVFDRKGNIVTIEAPRPSSPELKPLLEKLLAEK
ncbi:TlpA family protein disulfide reductase [Pseudoflavitalea sp. G-6-1-2]|uniref:TlpA family protein disulfide reductase n=1 Tax=Pseudoflavitalea sp. G-6-1-2 TaxID=2728841 RepID=UPI00146B54C0|nr:TlpA disulfide reductase family protein [Pseudoflavitalea sp. G-6-1-2]NML21205.1 TlpA family protein disulfide reductase [Pseudoflavitalea sp. G-6-1-2]